ncbi:MAG: LCP family protein [Mycobacteriales bacterium]
MRHRTPAPGGPWVKIAALLVAVGVVAGAGIAGGALARVRQLDNNVTRIDAFKPGARHPARPRPRVDGPLTFLVVGSDSRAKNSHDPRQVAATGGERTDTIMLVHLQRDQKHGYVVSIPRDTFVDIPKAPGWDGGRAKINAAFQYGGVPLLVQTVEAFTRTRIDHVVVIDFEGLVRVVDALGGIDVTVSEAVRDPETKARFSKGVNHLNGRRALEYVRERHGLPHGDFDRIKRQHQFLFALLSKAASTGTLTNPAKLNAFLDAASKSITVDRGMQLIDLAVQLSSLRPADFTFLTTPIAGDATDPVWGAILLPDLTGAAGLFGAMTDDTLAAWVVAHPATASDPTRGF